MTSLSSRRLLRRAWICAIMLLTTVGLPAWADDGLFEVTRGSLRAGDTQYLLDGQVDLLLSSEATEALESGLMLSIQMQFEITRQRRFWTDIQVASISRDFELQFKALSQRYLVTDNFTGEQQSYATLPSALRNLGRIRDWPVSAVDVINEDTNYECALRAVLNQDRLPGPLQILTFWRGDFSLDSDWYRWPLE
jgi:hypothetical protein